MAAIIPRARAADLRRAPGDILARRLLKGLANLLSFLSKLPDMFVVQSIGNRDVCIVPALIPSFITTEQENRRAPRIKGV
jgi:hypothetical protein